jgi:hypothetical protein
MKTAAILGLCVLLTHTSGCHTETASEVYTYTKAKARNIENKVVIDKPLDQVWHDISQHMPNTRYRIHNIDKVSRSIKIGFQTAKSGEVEKYIDCGSSTRVISYQDKSRIFHYALAGSERYETVSKDKDNFLYDVSPHMNLFGTVAINLLPLNDRQTEVRINTRYTMTRVLSVKSYAKDHNGSYQDYAEFRWDPIQVKLTTQKPGIYAENPAVQCVATGVLESKLLKNANNPKYASN